MQAKRGIKIFLEQRDIDVLKLDALLTHSTVSARLREVIGRHCRTLELSQPRAMFERRAPQEQVQ